MVTSSNNSILWFHEISMNDTAIVGGKNSSLGEMINSLTEKGIQVPNGFATTVAAFDAFLTQANLNDKIQQALAHLNVDDLTSLASTGQTIRDWITAAPFSSEFINDVTAAYQTLKTRVGTAELAVAVRSSATAEDLPNASFAGQQETFLNVTNLEDVLTSIKKVFASLYNDRAIAYRAHQHFDHEKVGISVGIQQMVRSDRGASGVMFTLDTESGFEELVFITASYGLGETVVQGEVNPDEFYVYKPALRQGKSAIIRRQCGSKAVKMVYAAPNQGHTVEIIDVPAEQRSLFSLNDDDVLTLAKYALIIEQHYGRPMDIEWAKDGTDQKLYILQARPETIKHQNSQQVIERYRLEKSGTVITTGRSIGQKIGAGTAKVLKSIKEIDQLHPGDVLVTDITDPDWEPIMRRAAAIVTNRGGRTCHAAIIARELGVPAIVGCGDATSKIQHNTPVTVSCAEGDTGYIYQGELPFKKEQVAYDHMPDLPVKIMLNVGNPERALAFHSIPNHGVGLARLEFIINKMIGIHPQALLEYQTLSPTLQQKIAPIISCYANPKEFYIERLKEGIASIASAFYPKPVIVRLSDFKSNEYRNLIGGKLYEPEEENPMIGFRGASRYISPSFRTCFEMECEAVLRARDGIGLTNIQVMIPFVRTLGEAKQVTELLASNGLRSGVNGLKIIMMCEVPSNAILAPAFLEYFDGFSIGSNDLTQLTLGLDRDSGIVASLFDERDLAIKTLLHQAIQACRDAKKYIGICGQGPSDHPDFANWLIQEGIDSISLNPDTVVDTWMYLSKQAKQR